MKKVDYYNKFIIYKKWVKQLIIKEKEKQYKIEPKKYYENNKEKLRAPAKNNCRELYEEEKDKETKRKTLEEIDIQICLKKINKN